MGTLSGIMGGLFAMQGPPAVIYFIGCTDDKDEYIALTQWYFLIGNVMMTVFRGSNGLVTTDVLEACAFAMVGVVLGVLIGSHVYDKLNGKTLKKIVYGYMAVAGLITMLS